MSSSTGRLMPRPALLTQTSMWPNALDRAIAQVLDVGPPGDVGRDHDRAVAGAGGGLPQLGLAPGGQRDAMAGGAELRRQRRADAAAGARDHDIFLSAMLRFIAYQTQRHYSSGHKDQHPAFVQAIVPLAFRLQRLAALV